MDAAKGFFDAWAEFYDADYEDQDIGDVAFYRELAREADGPVLEVGCGTGRIYLQLLRDGIDADGFDISEPMLSELERKADEAGLEPTVWQANMTAFDAKREYALVIVPFRTFLHNLTLADRKAALRNIRRALEPSGRLALDVFVPSIKTICDQYGEPRERTITRDGEEYVVTDVTRIEDEVALTVKADRAVRHGGEVVREAVFRLALVPRAEFELLFETTGWSDWTGYGGFDREPLADGADEMVWIAEK